jgi:predicted alpha/beta hydrolase family esterase
VPGPLLEKSFLLLHGWENRRPAAHWQHWLAGELAAAGAQVLYPQLPEPDVPVLEEWLLDLRRYTAAMRGEETVVIAHSLAVLLWWTAALSDQPVAVDRVLLVAPPSPAFLREQAVAAFVPGDMEHRPIDRAVLDTVRIVAGDDDLYCPGGARAVYADRYAIDTDVVPGGGHLDVASGYGPWPPVLQWCHDPTTRVRAR